MINDLIFVNWELNNNIGHGNGKIKKFSKGINKFNLALNSHSTILALCDDCFVSND